MISEAFAEMLYLVAIGLIAFGVQGLVNYFSRRKRRNRWKHVAIGFKACKPQEGK